MLRPYINVGCLMIVSAVAFAASSYADSSTTARRDSALKGIQACLRRNEVSSRECKSLNKNVQTLVDSYRQGDKSVLPTLLRFTYLSDFYGEALIGDPDGFLSAVSRLSDADQFAVASGLAGGMVGLLRPKFDAIRATLMTVPDSSPNYQLARTCLGVLETENASLLADYFPPQTFTDRAGEILVHWFSRELYALEEKPLWPPASGNQRTYRITLLPSFSPPESVTLTVSADGSGQINFRAADSRRQHLSVDSGSTMTPQQVAGFSQSLYDLQFWQLPTQLPQLRREIEMDGTEWILEGVEDGKYHVVLRWCPGTTPFGQAGRNLFEFAGHKLKGSC